MLFRIARDYRLCSTLLDRPKVVAEYLASDSQFTGPRQFALTR
jgi:hypothetical protein